MGDEKLRCGLVALVILAGCDGAARSSPVAAPLLNEGPSPSAYDSRNGVYAGVDFVSGDPSTYVTELRRVSGDGYEALTDPVPVPAADDYGVATVRWFPEGAWVGGSLADWLFRWSDGAWQGFAIADCDPGSTHDSMFLLDATSADEAWVVLYTVGQASQTLCHYDGATWSSEGISFQIRDGVATDDVMLLVDESSRLWSRPRAGGEWTQVELSGSPFRVFDTGTAILLFVDTGEVVETWRWTGSTAEGPDGLGIPGIGDDRWALELETEDGERCGLSLFGPSLWSCRETVERATYIVSRIEPDETRTEVAHLVLSSSEYGEEATSLEPLPVGPGRLGLIGSSGGFWVTP